MKVVIVGGVAGGATAAARIRRLNEQAEIVVFERSGYISYANCGLPYYIGDVITDPEELTLQTPESFFSRFRIMMKVLHEVTAIHHDRKTVSVRNLKTGEEFEEGYDKLILSPGAKPTQPKLSGMEANKLFTLRTVEDTFKIKAYINNNHPKSAVIAGGGFIGLELAENLRELGMDVTIVQSQKQLMMPFDSDMAAFIHAEVRKHGIHLVLGHKVEGFIEKDGGVNVLLSDGTSLPGDIAVLAIGVTPDTHLAKEAGLEKASRTPFRVVPFFDPGPWGGQWMKEVCDLDREVPNFAWCFDCVPEENSLYLGFGDVRFELPSIDLVFAYPARLLGNPVYGRFGDEFPIRFDFLDTMEGGNLSLQVHPLTQYIQEKFGMHYTQDESYYMLDAAEDATVYLGVKEGIEPEEMIDALNEAQESGCFDAEKYVGRYPVKKHDHLLIPAGTIHCSGTNGMVLEISATPYIFTFKLWVSGWMAVRAPSI